ncbi:3449_t:CDS:1, partial [Acaulospora colombiana]
KDSHEATGCYTSNGNGQDPSKYDPSQSLPVERADYQKSSIPTLNVPKTRIRTIAIAQANTQSGTGDAHGSRDRNTILRSENDSNSRSQFHRISTRRRLEGKSVAQHTHDIIAI